jgi:toxin ParE1/3/4
MLKWRLSKEAEDDMRNIRLYTQKYWGVEQSSRYIKEIRGKIELVAQNPRTGTDRSHDLRPGFRSIFIGSHTIYYEFNSKMLTVRAILHQAMTPAPHLRRKPE